MAEASVSEREQALVRWLVRDVGFPFTTRLADVPLPEEYREAVVDACWEFDNEQYGIPVDYVTREQFAAAVAEEAGWLGPCPTAR